MFDFVANRCRRLRLILWKRQTTRSNERGDDIMEYKSYENRVMCRGRESIKLIIIINVLTIMV